MQDCEYFDLGDIKLLSGNILKSAKLAYKTYGTLNKNSDNVIILPTFYTGTHKRNEVLLVQIELLIQKNILSFLLICLVMVFHPLQAIVPPLGMDLVFLI